MNSKERIIRESHTYRSELMEDILKANIEKIDYHRKQIKNYNSHVHEIGIIDRIKGNPLRSAKNHTLSLNSMCCLMAERGGMDAIMAHYQAEKYAILIEEATSMQKIYNLMDDFLYQYLHPKFRPIWNKGLLISERVNLFIGREFMNDISVQTIADNFYLTREHISRVYRNETNKTINAEILNVRIEEAKKFLSETRMTITEISLTVGFNSSQYFSKVFKELTGLTPSEYR